MKKYLSRIIQGGFFALFLAVTFKGTMVLWLVILLASMAAALFFGRFYCGYICPMSPVMDLTEKISKTLKIQSGKAPKILQNPAMPWVVLLLILGTMIFTKRVLEVEFPIVLGILALSALMTLKYEQSLFHNYFCPYSGFLHLAGAQAKWSKTVLDSSCNGCNKCAQVCPSDAVKINNLTKKAEISKSNCHQCQKCTDVCPQEAIQYGKAKTNVKIYEYERIL